MGVYAYAIPKNCLEEISVPAFDRSTNSMTQMSLNYHQLYQFERMDGIISYGWIDTNVDSYVRARKQISGNGSVTKDTDVVFMEYEYVDGIGVVKKLIPLDIKSSDPTSIIHIRPCRFVYKQNNQTAKGKVIAKIDIKGMDTFLLRKGNPISITTKELLNFRCEVVRIQKAGWFKRHNILYVRELDDTKHPNDTLVAIRMEDLTYISHLEITIKTI